MSSIWSPPPSVTVNLHRVSGIIVSQPFCGSGRICGYKVEITPEQRSIILGITALFAITLLVCVAVKASFTATVIVGSSVVSLILIGLIISICKSRYPGNVSNNLPKPIILPSSSPASQQNPGNSIFTPLGTSTPSAQ